MLSLSRIRQRMRQIESSSATSCAKVRALLRLRHRIVPGAARIAQIARTMFLAGDGAAACRFRNAAQRLVEVDAEITVRARQMLMLREADAANARSPRP